MKISRTRTNVEFETVQAAVADRLEPSAYSYEGQIEKLQQQITLLQEVVSTLVGLTKLSKYELEEVLGYGYEVEE